MGLDGKIDEWVAPLAEAKDSFVTALPNVLTALAVLLVGWALAVALRRFVHGAFRRLTARPDEEHPGGVAADGLYWLVLVGAAVLAVDALELPVLQRWMDTLGTHLPRVALAAALVLGGMLLGRLASGAILRARLRVPPTQARRLARLTQVLIVAASTLVAAAQLGLDVSLLTSFFLIAWAAALGAAALAFGLGAREVMADILAMHYVNKSYRIGQIVRVGSDEGRIVRTSRTQVYLESPEGELAIPGRHFTDSRCVLLSEEGFRGA
jgi:small-conductance mechanosensitive channel